MGIEIRINEETADMAIYQMRQMLQALTPTITVSPADVAAAEAAIRSAEPVATQENPSVATTAPTEKKTRSRKAKDAPAASVSSTDGQVKSIVDMAAATHEETVKAEMAISTGDERVGPEDTPEVVAQDEADEKAESDAARDPEKPVTLDDVRSALGEYVRLYGMDAAQADGPVVITKVCGDGKVKISDIADDKIAAVVSGVREMIAKNPFSREKVAA